jgi:hypothetical protein
MVTGSQPFSGSTYAAVIQKIIEGRIPHPSKLNAGVSAEAGGIIMKALSREPSRRFGTALEMARAIEAYAGQEKVWSLRNRLRRLVAGPDPASAASPDIRIRRRRPRRARRWVGGLAAAAVLSAAGYAAVQNPDVFRDLASRARTAIEDLRGRAPGETIEASGTPGGSMAGAFTSTADTSASAPDTSSVPAGGAEPVRPAGPPEGTAPDPDTIFVPASAEPAPGPEQEQAIEEEPAPSVGLLDIYVRPEAEIHVDGRWRASAERFGPVELEEGPHDITLRQRDYREYSERIYIRRGELSRRRIELQRVTGRLDFLTTAGASVFVNGKFHGTTPLGSPLQLPAGRYLVELKKHGYLTWSGEVDIPAEETLSLKIIMTRRQ